MPRGRDANRTEPTPSVCELGVGVLGKRMWAFYYYYYYYYCQSTLFELTSVSYIEAKCYFTFNCSLLKEYVHVLEDDQNGLWCHRAQRVTNFFDKKSESKYFRLYRPYSLCGKFSTFVALARKQPSTTCK